MILCRICYVQISDFHCIADVGTNNSCPDCPELPNVEYYILTGSITGTCLLGSLICFFTGIVACIIHRKKKRAREDEREMPIYDTIQPNYECVKHENILTLSVNDAYNL